MEEMNRANNIQSEQILSCPLPLTNSLPQHVTAPAIAEDPEVLIIGQFGWLVELLRRTLVGLHKSKRGPRAY